MAQRLALRAFVVGAAVAGLSTPLAARAQVAPNSGACSPPTPVAGPSGQQLRPSGSLVLWYDQAAGSGGMASDDGYFVGQTTGPTTAQLAGNERTTGLNGYSAGDPTNPAGGQGCLGIVGIGGLDVHPGP